MLIEQVNINRRAESENSLIDTQARGTSESTMSISSQCDENGSGGQ